MRLLVEARPDRSDEAARAAQAALLATHINNNIGISADVIVNDPGKVEHSGGQGLPYRRSAREELTTSPAMNTDHIF